MKKQLLGSKFMTWDIYRDMHILCYYDTFSTTVLQIKLASSAYVWSFYLQVGNGV